MYRARVRVCAHARVCRGEGYILDGVVDDALVARAERPSAQLREAAVEWSLTTLKARRCLRACVRV